MSPLATLPDAARPFERALLVATETALREAAVDGGDHADVFERGRADMAAELMADLFALEKTRLLAAAEAEARANLVDILVDAVEVGG